MNNHRNTERGGIDREGSIAIAAFLGVLYALVLVGVMTGWF